MKNPVVMIAFGTTSKATTTYEFLHEKISQHFHDREVFWAFSSKIITRQLNLQKGKKIQPPEKILQHIARSGYHGATVQSLHLFPGTEFNALRKKVAGAELACHLGNPLLTSPADYSEICRILTPLAALSPDTATVIIGHGTKHPAWTGYFCLEKYLRRSLDADIYVGTVEGYPDSDNLVNEIAAAGYKKVRLIPFFLVTGMHFKRDISGGSEKSWQSRFMEKGLETEAVEQGLGMLEGFDKLIIRHIENAAPIP
jgi:sirohydrochlorin cobaltochelatase